MILATLLLLLPCTLTNTAQISDTVFFTWYVHLCLPKPLETLLTFAFHPFFLIFKAKRLLTWTFPSSSLLSSFFLFPHACTVLNSPLPPGLPMYQLQLTTSQVGLQDISEHRGAAGSLSASSLTPPNFGSWAPLMSCPRQAERHLAKPQKHFQLQTAWCSPQRETRPKVEELIKSYHITIHTYSSLIAVQSSFISFLTEISLRRLYLNSFSWCWHAKMFFIRSGVTCRDGHPSVLGRAWGLIRDFIEIAFFN